MTVKEAQLSCDGVIARLACAHPRPEIEAWGNAWISGERTRDMAAKGRAIFRTMTFDEAKQGGKNLASERAWRRMLLSVVAAEYYVDFLDAQSMSGSSNIRMVAELAEKLPVDMPAAAEHNSNDSHG
jgi:hypothetical protein